MHTLTKSKEAFYQRQLFKEMGLAGLAENLKKMGKPIHNEGLPIKQMKIKIWRAGGSIAIFKFDRALGPALDAANRILPLFAAISRIRR